MCTRCMFVLHLIKLFLNVHNIFFCFFLLRTQDLKTKKQHIPVVDRTPLEPPPIIVGVVGPPKVGKSTLLRCVVKNFTKQRLTKIQGPVTVVSGKQRRLTLIECNNDISAMIDLAKVADLVRFSSTYIDQLIDISTCIAIVIPIL